MSPSNTYGAGDLLEYNSTHKLLICRQCQYAIQKNALDSHLLRHKIYRGERQDLLSSVAHLDLLEPEDVPLPAPGRPPVEALPILSGFRCAVSGCEHLTVSSKRMRRHWTEVHGLDGTVANPSSLAREVKLQTFFRGTKVRYFEVASGSGRASSTGSENNNEQNDRGGGREEESHPRAAAAVPQQALSERAGASELDSYPSPSDLNLDTLSYFHHFMTETSPTLPVPDNTQDSMTYWQLHVIPQALQRRWLMCGVLAVSAHHLAVLTKDINLKKSHRDRMMSFSSEFFAELEQLAERTFDFESAIVEAEPKQIGGQIAFLLKCTSWTLPTLTNKLEPAGHSRLSWFMFMIRNTYLLESANHYAGVPSTGSSDQGERFRETHLSTDSGSMRHADLGVQSNSTPPMVLDHLRMLPFRLADRLERPERVEDVLTTMTSITSLVKYCDMAFAQNEALAMWQCAAAWSASIPDHFNHMLLHHHPAALITLAHWAAILVLRAENAGVWYVRGLTDAIMLEASTQLANSDATALDMIENLTDLADG